MSDTAVLALISAGAGLVGAGIGGFATWKVENKRQEFDRARLDDHEQMALRSISRVTIGYLDQSMLKLERQIEQNRWPETSGTLRVKLPLEDRKVIAAGATGTAWAHFVFTDNLLSELDASSVSRTSSSFADDDRHRFEEAVRAIERTKLALAPLTG